MSTAAKTTTDTPTPSNRWVSWAQFGLDTAADIQKQWMDIAVAYGDLALQARKENLARFESFYKQTRKAVEKINEGQEERLRSTLDRLS